MRRADDGKKASCRMRRAFGRLFRALAPAMAVATLTTAFPQQTLGQTRFFHSGDGMIRLSGEKTGAGFDGRYRTATGGYDPAAIAAICRVFGAPCAGPDTEVSLRLIEYLDFLQDRLGPDAGIRIVSGYRSPVYNTRIRENGAMAAKASLHQYGMAADLVMEGVPARRVWETVRQVGFGGTGYYHGETVHVDTGPARSWDETTSGVGTGISDDNKLIGLVSDFDRYRPGEPVKLRFVRMTAFPIQVDSRFSLEKITGPQGEKTVFRFIPSFAAGSGRCVGFSDIGQMAAVRFELPRAIAPGRYKVTARFCNRKWPGMPPKVSTPPFQVSGS